MTAVQPRHGWYRDPSGRHAMRYCDDGHWTAWAADDGGDPQFDETGAAIASEPSWLSTGPGRMVLVGFVAVAVAAVGSLLGGFMALAALFDTESS